MERFSIQIPQPCHQRWDEMQPTERGWFCASCQKTVVDYTNFSDQELVKLLSKPLDTTCGRFRNEQLNRMLTAPNAVTSRVWRHWANLLTLSLFGWQTARAQFNQPAQPAFIQQIPVTPAIRVTTQLSHTATDKNWVIYGRVVTKDSSGNLLPLPDATIFVLQSGNNLVIRTDQAGAYSLSV